MKKEAEDYGHHTAEAGMDDKENGQHHPDGANVDHDADIPSVISNDDKASEASSSQHGEENHSH
jgi:hypothetical protein